MKRAIESLLRDVARGDVGPAIARRAKELLAGPTPRKAPTKARIASIAHVVEVRQAKDRTALDRRAETRRHVSDRAAGLCEACGARRGAALQWDHFWGRDREESVESTWMLCAHCHRAKTDNDPSRITWLWSFYEHCRRLGFAAQAAKAGKAIQFERAQHPEDANAHPR